MRSKKRAASDENLNMTLERVFNHIEDSAKGNESEDTREVIDIVKLNAEIEEIVAREQVLRDEIAKIIAEIEVG